jgi:hypothetical protein
MNHNMWTIYIFNSNIYIYIYIFFAIKLILRCARRTLLFVIIHMPLVVAPHLGWVGHEA